MNNLTYVSFSDCLYDPENSTGEIAHKSDVVAYLRSNRLGAMCAGWMRDRFTGKLVRGCYDHYRSDGRYAWGESLAYYLDKYNLVLPPEFLAHIYREMKV